MKTVKGIIFNIQRYSLHDGPGIRTTVFLKGCPLKCIWCQNPEGISREPLLIRHRQKCISCYSCYEHCPRGAVKKGPAGPLLDQSHCCNCMSCSDYCPAGAIEKAGREIETEELFAGLLKDRIIFEESGGGVTFSGGEPLFQPDFLFEMLLLLKKSGINTAIETCGYSSWQTLEQAAKLTNLVIYDLKLIDSERYMEFTGISGARILENLKMLTDFCVAIQVRMFLIKGINDDVQSLAKAAAYLQGMGINTVELIPYHSFGEAKYEKIGKDYKLKGLPDYNEYDLHLVRKILNDAGIVAHCGG